MTVRLDRLKKCHDRSLPGYVQKRVAEIEVNKEVTYCICGKPDDGFSWYFVKHVLNDFMLHVWD